MTERNSKTKKRLLGLCYYFEKEKVFFKDGSNKILLLYSLKDLSACLPACMCMYVCRYSQRPEGGTRSPRAKVRLGTELCSLQEQTVTLNSHLFSPCCFNFLIEENLKQIKEDNFTGKKCHSSTKRSEEFSQYFQLFRPGTDG